MPSSLSDVEAIELHRLLQIVVVTDSGWIPNNPATPEESDSIWKLTRRFLTAYAPEVIPWRLRPGRLPEFLLHWRDDVWTGWCLSGGWPPPGSTVRTFAAATAAKDFGNGGDLFMPEYVSGVIALKSWGETHPYGYPVSGLHAIEVKGDIEESDTVQWFSDIPTDPDWTEGCGRRYDGMVDTGGIHEELIRTCLRWINTGRTSHGVLLD